MTSGWAKVLTQDGDAKRTDVTSTVRKPAACPVDREAPSGDTRAAGAGRRTFSRHHVERDVGIAVVDPVAARAPGDHGEDDLSETVDQARLEERTARCEAA